MKTYLLNKVSAAFARASERPAWGSAVLGVVVLLSAASVLAGLPAAFGALAAGAYLVKPKEPAQPSA